MVRVPSKNPEPRISNSPLYIALAEHLLGVPAQDVELLIIAQPVHCVDERFYIVVPATRTRIRFRPCAWALCPEQDAIRSRDLEQQFQGFCVVKGGIEIELFEPFVEVLRVIGASELRPPPSHLVRNRSASV